MVQRIHAGANASGRIPELLRAAGAKRALLVCGKSFDRLPLRAELEGMDVPFVRFGEFHPNPDYEDVRRGVARFCAAGCDSILAVGGGSAIDVAKCIKLYCRLPLEADWLAEPGADTHVPLIAVPTTAGTGSESTRFAVIYRNGEKQSVRHESILPDAAILLPGVLAYLPVYQKKCTLLDALCQAIESWWSVNSTPESVVHARAAIAGILQNYRAYLRSGGAAEEIMIAANAAGQAINLTQTTAPHAMGYKLTKLYGLPHGHAVALGLAEVWPYMNAHMEDCIDPRGREYLSHTLAEIAAALGSTSATAGAECFRALLAELEMERPRSKNRAADLDLLAASVNPVRLKNNPVALDEPALQGLYERIVRE